VLSAVMSSPKPTLMTEAIHMRRAGHTIQFLGGVVCKFDLLNRRSKVLSVQVLGLLIGMKDRLSVD
jgi:hypothetical protein